MSRTTHSDLARELAGLATKLQGLPGSTPNADATIREMLTAAARILVVQDVRIDTQTVALRSARTALRDYIEICDDGETEVFERETCAAKAALVQVNAVLAPQNGDGPRHELIERIRAAPRSEQGAQS